MFCVTYAQVLLRHALLLMFICLFLMIVSSVPPCEQLRPPHHRHQASQRRRAGEYNTHSLYSNNSGTGGDLIDILRNHFSFLFLFWSKLSVALFSHDERLH